MKKIGLVVAMDKEFGLLRGLMSGGRDVSCQGLEFFEGKIGGKDVVLARSGMGKVCAAVGVLELIKNFAPDCVINTGVASFAGSRELLDAVTSLDAEVNVYGGQICTGDKFITERAELDMIKAKFPDGLAVDMESAAMAQVCHMYRVPFLSLRIISDTPGIENHQQQYESFWDEAPKKSLEVVEKLLAKL